MGILLKLLGLFRFLWSLFKWMKPNTPTPTRSDRFTGDVPSYSAKDIPSFPSFGAVVYVGEWDASINSPAIPEASISNKGHYFLVSVSGSAVINGVTDWKAGQWIVSDGARWTKHPEIVESTVVTSRVVWVDSQSGNDVSGAPNRLDRPFKTLRAAQGAASAGYTIIVLPGVYADMGLGKPDVNWFFYSGAKILITDPETVTSGFTYIWGNPSDTVANFTVGGFGEFRIALVSDGGSLPVPATHVVRVSDNSKIVIHGNVYGDDSPTQDTAHGLLVDDGDLEVRGNVRGYIGAEVYTGEVRVYGEISGSTPARNMDAGKLYVYGRVIADETGGISVYASGPVTHISGEVTGGIQFEGGEAFVEGRITGQIIFAGGNVRIHGDITGIPDYEAVILMAPQGNALEIVGNVRGVAPIVDDKITGQSTAIKVDVDFAGAARIRGSVTGGAHGVYAEGGGTLEIFGELAANSLPHAGPAEGDGALPKSAATVLDGYVAVYGKVTGETRLEGGTFELTGNGTSETCLVRMRGHDAKTLSLIAGAFKSSSTTFPVIAKEGGLIKAHAFKFVTGANYVASAIDTQETGIEGCFSLCASNKPLLEDNIIETLADGNNIVDTNLV